MPTTKEIEAAAEAVRETMANMYGLDKPPLDDGYQIARAALHAAEIVRDSCSVSPK